MACRATGANLAVIIGGGVVGSACALRLQRAGLSTLVLDHAGPMAPASLGNAGHIAVEQTAPLASPQALRRAPGRLFALGGALDFRLRDIGAWGPWGVRYLRACGPERAAAGARALTGLLAEAMPAWRRLARDLDAPDLVMEAGHLLVWETSRTAAAGRTAWMRADVGTARVRDLLPTEMAILETRVRPKLVGGLAFDGTGQVRDLNRLMTSLRAAHEAAGGLSRSVQVEGLELDQDQASVRLAGGETLLADLIVVAGGVGSGPLMRSLGHVAPVIAERGYHIEGDAGELDLSDWGALPPVVFEDRDLIVTRFGDRLRAASFVEFARPESPADPRKWARLHRHASDLGLPLTGEITRWMGSRPTLPDYLPALGRSRRATNLIYAFGHQHLGLTLAPLTGELIADLALGRDPTVQLAPFDLARFERG